MKQFHVYILASRSGTLYVGITSDLLRRVYEHRQHLVPGHTQRYRITRLVYYEDAGPDAYAAIDREKQIKMAPPEESGTHRIRQSDLGRLGGRLVRLTLPAFLKQIPHCVRDDTKRPKRRHPIIGHPASRVQCRVPKHPGNP